MFITYFNHVLLFITVHCRLIFNLLQLQHDYDDFYQTRQRGKGAAHHQVAIHPLTMPDRYRNYILRANAHRAGLHFATM